MLFKLYEEPYIEIGIPSINILTALPDNPFKL